MEPASECSLSVLSPCSELVQGKDCYSVDDWKIIKIRSGIRSIKTICDNHAKIYLNFYEKRQSCCCDPFIKHKTKVRATVKVITLEMHRKSKMLSNEFREPLIPGKKLCSRCCSSVLNALKDIRMEDVPTSDSSAPSSQDLLDPQKVAGSSNITPLASGSNEMFDVFFDEPNMQEEPSTAKPTTIVREAPVTAQTFTSSRMTLRPQQAKVESNVDTESQEMGSQSSVSTVSSGEVFLTKQSAIETINASLRTLKESPLLKRKLSAPTYGPSKLIKMQDKVKSLLVKSGVPETSFEKQEDVKSKLIEVLKEKFISSHEKKDEENKIFTLSVALAILSARSVFDIFGPLGATDWLIRKTAKLMDEQDGLFPKVAPRKGVGLPEETIRAVIEFYENESRQLPGKKDYVTVRENGVKTQVQKKLVLCNLSELHTAFKNENPTIKIGKSKFAALRPKHCVLAGASGTHSICVCRYHQNFKLLLDGGNLKGMDPAITDYKYVMSAVLCDPPTAECYTKGCCKDCPGFETLKENILNLFEENFVQEIKFNQWSAVDRSSFDTLVLNTPDFVDLLFEQLKELLPHHYIAKQQAKFLKCLKDELEVNEAINILDFSENYSFVIQDSVQGYYWSNDQATIHPLVTYYKDPEDPTELKVISHVMISDFMKHGKSAVYAFQKQFVASLKEILPGLKKIHYLSDGAAQQYKNMFNMLKQTYHLKDFGVKSEWHFFATSHGKGPSDGVGGTIKRCAAKASLQGAIIRTAEELYNWAKTAMSGMIIFFVTTAEVIQAAAFLEERFLTRCPKDF